MSIQAAIGYAHGLDGRETALQAAHQALDRIGNISPALAMVFFSAEYAHQQVAAAVSSLLGATPVWGFSAPALLYNSAPRERSVLVALLAGDLKAQAAYLAPSRTLSRASEQSLVPGGAVLQPLADALLIGADGYGADISTQLSQIPAGLVHIYGALAGGDSYASRAYFLAGTQAGAGGGASVLINGAFAIGAGAAHGWQNAGIYFRITQAGGVFVRSIDNAPPSETYAQNLGYSPKEWTQSPLNELIRMYPLGIENEDGSGLTIRAPLRMENNGSLRLSCGVPEGSTAHLMIGNPAACLQAARQAAQTALEKIGSARPVLGIVFVDISWRSLLTLQAGQELQAVQETLGIRVPLAGVYTLGQIRRAEPNTPVELLNQHIQVIVLGEKP